jgi:transcriptional regulator with XRE-family HTH domain
MHSQPHDSDKRRRRVFLRLHEDVSEAMNHAVQSRLRQGASLAAIARRMGVDRAFLTRVLQGQAGTSLRTIAKLLYATDYRLKVDLVSCDALRQASNRLRKVETHWTPELHWHHSDDLEIKEDLRYVVQTSCIEPSLVAH